MAKRCKINSNTEEVTQIICEDYITKLPESVATHILSLLPTKEAVKTCVLSKDWEYKWTSINDIMLTDEAEKGKNTPVFAEFMERISRHSLSYNVKFFTLICHKKYDFNRMKAWISPVFGPNLDTFILLHYEKGFVMPQRLLKCTALKTLALSLPCTLGLPAVYGFTNLTCLLLNRVEIVNENSNSDTMILKFPVLKYIELSKSKWLNVKFIEIHAPSLHTFLYITEVERAVKEYMIKILGATLKNFEFRGGLQDSFVLSRSTVVCATLQSSRKLRTLKKIESQVRMLFNELSTVKNLRLKGAIMKGIVESNIGFPRFSKLRRIVISDGGNLNFLLEFIRAAPNLYGLGIDVRGWDDFNYDEVDNVPHSFASSLETVRFDYPTYKPDSHFRLERFILKFGASLKRVRFMVDDPLQEDEILTRLSSLPAASDSSEILPGQKS